MPDPGQKSFRFHPGILDDFWVIVTAIGKVEPKVKPSHVASAALLSFLEATEKEQVRFIQRIRTYELEKTSFRASGGTNGDKSTQDDDEPSPPKPQTKKPITKKPK